MQLGLEQVGHKQELKLELVGRRPEVVVRRQGLRLGLVVHKLEVLTFELADKLTELVELKVNIVTAAVIEEADNIEEELVVMVEL